ncbi:hypothetical protein COV24_03200 [candidate division WWE3 bacterium CG10_big_fil_rev_8_21_14_0_10_32_10]|uniref:Thymidylate synthase n=1 Tax=candidate division WWE3 bacterium CG10_big_fil_rev_8_21_14_0_10_32_10 TaxID=1975090 RepID=A0A2H0RBZ9_UNCKA|nr:MAG: hypothetical protein COV24_03200 [candidate division WWE3 bacterium CG10_big_fil_rev_8_21_14_0_10_32_10]
MLDIFCNNFKIFLMSNVPNYQKLELTKKEKYLLEPFFTNISKSVYAVTFLPPEVIGALCSRSSRAKDDLRLILLNEFIKPFLEEGDKYGKSLQSLIDFLHKNPWELIFANPKGREFYIKWLAQYGDDSIAQMSGTHLIYQSLSQIAIKYFEDMRVGIAPIEKSTRYVDYSSKVNGKYRYYIDPKFKILGLDKEYKQVMDNLFKTYTSLYVEYAEYLKKHNPNEPEYLIRTKALDTVRGLLPLSTLSQVSFFANGASFEYFVARGLDNNLGEVRWAAEEAKKELDYVIPAFLRRIDSTGAKEYRNYLSTRSSNLKKALKSINWKNEVNKSKRGVKLLEYDKNAENKIIAGLIYTENKEEYKSIYKKVKKLSKAKKQKILDEVLKNRKQRWYKMPRAFENAYLRFEITMNIAGWRDLHRHRMQTQYREKFNIYNGFEVPKELKKLGYEKKYVHAIEKLENLYKKVEKVDVDLAQYCVSFSHLVKFVQYQNLRAFFWESELRTIAQGHPDYRKIEQEKVKIIKKKYPLLSKYIMADMNNYEFARRGSEEQIKAKEAELKEQLRGK